VFGFSPHPLVIFVQKFAELTGFQWGFNEFRGGGDAAWEHLSLLSRGELLDMAATVLKHVSAFIPYLGRQGALLYAAHLSRVSTNPRLAFLPCAFWYFHAPAGFTAGKGLCATEKAAARVLHARRGGQCGEGPKVGYPDRSKHLLLAELSRNSTLWSCESRVVGRSQAGHGVI